MFRRPAGCLFSIGSVTDIAHLVETMMDSSEDVVQLLTEIRDLEREHLAEYKEFTTRALELQKEAVARQAAIGVLYKRVLAVCAIVVGCLLAYLVTVVEL